MNILLITARSDMGGGPRHLFDILLELKKNTKHQIYICSPLNPPYGNLFLEHCDGHFQIRHRNFSILYFIKLVNWAKKNQIDVVHSHGRGAGLYARLMNCFGFKTIHTYHGIHTPKNFIDRIKLYVEKSLLNLTDRIVFIGHDEQAQFSVLFNDSYSKINLIPNGIDCESLKANSNLRPKSDTLTLGVLSRLDEHKGVLFVVQSILKLSDRYNLVVAGDGPQSQEISDFVMKNSLNKRVFLLGEIKEPIVFFNQIDILVSNSKSEGMPYSVIEALCLRKKLLLSDVPGHQQFSQYAQLFEPNNFQSFFENLETSLNDDTHHVPYTWNRSQMCKKLESEVYAK